MQHPTVQISQLENIEWLNGIGCTFTLFNTNDVWRIQISAYIPNIDDLWHLLNADEKERSGRYYREKDKERFVVSRGVLRILLGKYLNVEAKQITFETGKNKKPHVKSDTHIHYNVSHSGDYVLIAISASELGVDVESIDLDMHFAEIMSISYSEAEIEYVDRSKSPLQSFYTLWTRKEALLKATAKGIDDHLKLIPSLNGEHSISPDILDSPKNWIVSSFGIDDIHLGSVASVYSKTTFWESDLY